MTTGHGLTQTNGQAPKNPLRRSTTPFDSGSWGRSCTSFTASAPTKEATPAARRPPRPMPASLSQINRRGARPSPWISSQDPSSRSSVRRVGSIRPVMNRECAATITSTGSLSVFHFGYGRMMPIHYGLYEDARRYDGMDARIDMPTLVFQGRHDTAVDPVTVQAWSRARPNVELHMLDDDHQLTASVEYIWGEMKRFLGIGGADDHPAR